MRDKTNPRLLSIKRTSSKDLPIRSVGIEVLPGPSEIVIVTSLFGSAFVPATGFCSATRPSGTRGSGARAIMMVNPASASRACASVRPETSAIVFEVITLPPRESNTPPDAIATTSAIAPAISLRRSIFLFTRVLTRSPLEIRSRSANISAAL